MQPEQNLMYIAYTVMSARGGTLRATDCISQIAQTCHAIYVLYIRNFSHSKSKFNLLTQTICSINHTDCFCYMTQQYSIETELSNRDGECDGLLLHNNYSSVIALIGTGTTSAWGRVIFSYNTPIA